MGAIHSWAATYDLNSLTQRDELDRSDPSPGIWERETNRGEMEAVTLGTSQGEVAMTGKERQSHEDRCCGREETGQTVQMETESEQEWLAALRKREREEPWSLKVSQVQVS